MRWRTFLKDVFICSLGSYGGPEAHYGVFTDQMVIKKRCCLYYCGCLSYWTQSRNGLGSIFLAYISDNRIVHLFESFYRYGYLVIGGGQVVVPLMYSELVEVNQFMTNQEFLTGFGLVQGLPGPMFSFSAYAGGIAIFLPGLLLIYFIYPIWENLNKIKGIKVSLKGITAVAGGLITIAGAILMQNSGFAIDNIIVTLVAMILLLTKKIPAPLIVLLALVAGFVVLLENLI